MNPLSSNSLAAQPAARTPVRSPLLECLTFLALLIGLVAAASYAQGTTTPLRIFRPALGAWLDSHQFYLMEGGATALGLIVGIRLGRRLAAESVGGRHGANSEMILAALAYTPLIHVCAAAARLGWSGRGGSVASWIVGREGYEAGAKFLRLFITAIYFLKTAGLAALAGLAMIALGVALVSSHEAVADKPSAGS